MATNKTQVNAKIQRIIKELKDTDDTLNNMLSSPIVKDGLTLAKYRRRVRDAITHLTAAME